MASTADGDDAIAPQREAAASPAGRPPILRSTIAGVLMGLANLVPGVSGGTMIVVMGLYDDFIESIAGLTRLKLTRRNLLFLAIVGGAAAVAIASLAGTLGRAVTLHRSAMFSLFVGMTLGGAPLLVRMIEKFDVRTIVGVLVGLAIMILIAVSHDASEAAPLDRGVTASAEIPVVNAAYGRDVLAGVLGMSAMVLPGISGAYMLLILGRYETILASISIVKNAAIHGGAHPELAAALRVLVPTAIGALLSLVCLSNVLKWMLRHRRNITLGMLLGVLLGSVVGIWPFGGASVSSDYFVGAVLALVGFVATVSLSRIRV